MLEIASLTGSDAPVKQWINEALQHERYNDTSLHSFASDLIRKLQLQTLELNHSLEECSSQALTSIPKALREIENIRLEALDLKHQIDAFDETLSKIEDSTERSIEFLAELDQVKEKMEKCILALEQVERLSSLMEGVDEIIETNNYEQIVDQIYQMQTSVDVLQNFPEFEKQREHVVTLVEKFEQKVKPALVTSFELRSSDKIKTYFEMFELLGRSDQFLEVYYDFITKPLQHFWNSYNFPEDTFEEWLPLFFDQLVTLLSSEVSWTARVFPKRYCIPADIVEHIYEELHSSFEERLKPATLDSLISICGSTATLYQTLTALLPPSACNRLILIENLVFSPLLSYMDRYSEYEKQILSKELKGLTLNKEDFNSTLREIHGTVGSIFHLAEDAIGRCIQFTGGAEFVALSNVLSDYFVDYIDRLCDLLAHLRHVSKLDVDYSTSQATSTEEPVPETIAQEPSITDSFSQNDWTYFQGSLKLLETANSLLKRLTDFDISLRNSFLDRKYQILGKEENLEQPQVPCVSLRNNPEKAKKLQVYFKNLEDVAVKLLPIPSKSFSDFNSRVQSFVYDTMFQFIKERLLKVPSLDIWTKERAESLVPLPTFNLQPSAYITQIGEHLLMLRQQLEPFASNELLTQQSHITISMSKESNLPSTSDSQKEDEGGFAFQWISVVARGTTSLYFDRITQIETLSELGAQQLQADIGYLFVVLSALNVQVDSSLQQLQRYLGTPKEEYAELVKTSQGTEKKLASVVARMRQLILF